MGTSLYILQAHGIEVKNNVLHLSLKIQLSVISIQASKDDTLNFYRLLFVQLIVPLMCASTTPYLGLKLKQKCMVMPTV